jgi:hypothetical protein
MNSVVDGVNQAACVDIVNGKKEGNGTCGGEAACQKYPAPLLHARDRLSSARNRHLLDTACFFVFAKHGGLPEFAVVDGDLRRIDGGLAR